jgi:hypothetical protein
VYVKELAAYVREATYTAAKAFGHPPQLPKLYGTGKDFFLRHVPTGGPVAMPTLAEPEAVPDWWTDSEKFQDAWVKTQGARRLPNIAIEGNLAREQALAAWLAGYDPAALAARFTPKEQARRAAMAAATPVLPPLHTLARIRTNPEFAAKVVAAQALLAPVFDKIRDGGGKPEDLMMVQDPAWAKAAEHPGEAVCEAALKFAVALEDVKFDQVKKIAATVAGFRPKAKPFEWSVFEFVAGFDPELVKQWPKGTLRRVMLLVPTMGEAIATDGRNLSWIRTAAESAQGKATQALVTLGSSDSSDAEMRDAAPKLDEARQENVRVNAAASVLTATRAEYEDARAELSDLSAGFPHEFAAIPADVASTWAALADSFTKAEGLLVPPVNTTTLPALEPFSQAKDGVLVARTSLRAMVKVPDDASTSQLGRALAWTGWSMAERAALIARYDSVSRAAATKMLNAWPSSPSGLNLPAPPKTFQPAVKLAPDLRPKAEWTQPAEEQKYQDWLGRTVYPTMATAWRKLKTDAATEAAKNLERIARESLDWRAGTR